MVAASPYQLLQRVKDDPTLQFSTANISCPLVQDTDVTPHLTFLWTPLDPDLVLTCDPGFYCPNLRPMTLQLFPFSALQAACVWFTVYQVWHVRHKGKHEPSICKAGHYCPDYRTRIICPQGFFCPAGSIAPRPCELLASCPTGTITPTPIAVREGAFRKHDFRQVFSRLIGGASYVLQQRAKEAVVSAEHEVAATKAAAEAAVADAVAGTMHPTASGMLSPVMSPAMRCETMRKKETEEELRKLVQYCKACRVRQVQAYDGHYRTLWSRKDHLHECFDGQSSTLQVEDYTLMVLRLRYISTAKIIGYVPQEDVMLRELTNSTPRSWTRRQIEDHVDNVLKALNLTHVANSFIGDETDRGVSGGQRKRVNIGMELAAAPLAIFLDEPTSGLDATAALEVADILASIAHLGLTVVSVIHQPRIEIFRKFDDVLMIAPGGKVAYLGPISQAQRYFESLGFYFDPEANMSDVLMDILSGKARNDRYSFGPEQLVAAWENGKVRDYLMDTIQGDEIEDGCSAYGGVGHPSYLPMSPYRPPSHMDLAGTLGRSSSGLSGSAETAVDQWLVTIQPSSEEETTAGVVMAEARAAQRPGSLRYDEEDRTSPIIVQRPTALHSDFGTIGGPSRTWPRSSGTRFATFQVADGDGTVSAASSMHRTSRPPSPSLSAKTVTIGVNQPASPITMAASPRSPSPGAIASPHHGTLTNVPDGVSVVHRGLPMSPSSAALPWLESPEPAPSIAGSYTLRRVLSNATVAHSIIDSIGRGIPVGTHSGGSAEDDAHRLKDLEFHRLAPQVVRERGAGFVRQVIYCHNRSLVQQGRRAGALVLELFVALFAGLLMGISAQGKIKEMFNGIYRGVYVVLSPAPFDIVSLYGLLLGIAVALAGAPSGVKVFGEERTIFWREAASGHSRLAYYTGKTIATAYRLLVSSLHFTALYLVFARPVVSSVEMYGLVLLQFWGVYGMACVISVIVRRENASLLAVVIGLFAAVFCGYGPSLAQAKAWNIVWIYEMSFNKWAAEAHYSLSLRFYKHVYDTDMSARLYGYTLGQVVKDFVACLLLGVVWRVIGFVLMVTLNKEKQR
ncbi:hypothetical protein BC829DRAFT_420151 [Chytridium lagenaria]|nr:hypothetical protein BC829DRAFT_420151 [Chytridium lagenaria]